MKIAVGIIAAVLLAEAARQASTVFGANMHSAIATEEKGR
jgi:hypothetical protein